MAAYEVLLLNTAIPQIQAAQSGDTYVVPRDIAINASASITGNLGIGTSSPAQKLEVQSTAGATVLVSSSTTGGSTCAVQFKPGFSGVYGDQKISAINAELRISSSTVGGANAITTFYNGASEAARITSGGDLLVGTTSVLNSAKLTVSQASGVARLSIQSTLVGNSDASVYLECAGTDSSEIKYLRASQALTFITSGSERARITSGGVFQVSSGGSVQVGGTAARATTAGTNRLDIFNGTAPVGTLTNGISIYSSSGEAYVMDAAGNATLFSPHDAETNEWIFKSKHTPTGKVLKIDVERLLKFVNDHFGLDAVHEFVEE